MSALFYITAANCCSTMFGENLKEVSHRGVINSPVLFVSVVSSDKPSDEGKQHDAQTCRRHFPFKWNVSLNHWITWQWQKTPFLFNCKYLLPCDTKPVTAQVVLTGECRLSSEVSSVQTERGSEWKWRREPLLFSPSPSLPPSLFLFLRPTGCLLSLVNDSAWVRMFDCVSVGVCMCVCLCEHALWSSSGRRRSVIVSQ